MEPAGHRDEVVMQPIERVIALSRFDPDAPAATALQTHVAHQTLDSAACDSDLVFVELVPDLVGAIDREVLFPHPQDLRAQLAITNRTR